MKVANINAEREREIAEFKIQQDETIAKRDIEKNRQILTAEVAKKLSIEQAEVDPNTVPQFEAEAERLLTGPEPQIDRAIAIMKRMGLTNPGREGLRRLQYRVFGRQDDRAVDPSTLQNQGREIWEQAIKDIPHEVAPDFRAPAQAAYDGYSADAYMKAGYTTKKDAHTFALDHYEDVTLPDGTVRLGNPGFTREAVDNIMLGLSNPQTKKNVDNDNWQEMWRFLQDPRAAKIMADTTLKDAEGKDIKGTQILEEIYNQGRKYGADGKVAQRVTNAADARAYDATRPDQPPTQLFDYIPVVTARQAADYNAGPRTLTGGAPIAAGDPVPRDPANKRIDDSINYIKRELAAKGIVVP